ncbi:MAG: NAD(P)H-hydrate dehydratase [Candidatus Eisenbacteria bacterium]|uniref:Bifunctional NAD(P)H-hydrate repair enzyme n=1 Tax=Eiseniibacteriota bacterium TaxID=2212470 RepID=A0A948W5A4_UNCEI|nr:NAD(P)H-hydrate dehydratase [Candidatus Eisenbacteria bacterium]MBU1948625.1 NAD(P)H-hydrate dehydratase [Candidatus Eisenbacteria bacterium]MBU2689381.1 NAD(P)H-hydrate dehydratase [Candidatus Eisenbacteria bacterium]
MRVVTPEQMRALDQHTIQNGVPGPRLMERAGWGLALALWRHIDRFGARPVLILCGPGNNGGDGFVLARLLWKRGLRPDVVLVGARETVRGDARQALARLMAVGCSVRICSEARDLEPLVRWWGARTGAVVVDALLGTGTQGAPRGLIAEAIKVIHEIVHRAGALVVAVDVPTGVDTLTGAVSGEAISADLTVTMANPKTGFFFYPGRNHIGRVVVVDIGVKEPRPEALPLDLSALTAPEAALLVPRRRHDAHKGDLGRVIVLGGSPGLTGAVALAAEASVAAGAGLVTVGVPAGLHSIFESKLTEPMSIPLAETDGHYLAVEGMGTILKREPGWDVAAFGPGLGRYPEAHRVAADFYTHFPGPLVVDADGLNALGEGEWPPRSGPPAILTPHPGEMSRLLGIPIPDVISHPMEIAQACARDRKAVVILKGGPTLVASPDGAVSFNPTGNPGMATGGSGDVLTGILAGLLAQGLPPWDAARLGVYLHGLAGDIAAMEKGWHSMKAGDITRCLSKAFSHVDQPMTDFEESLVMDRIDEAASL